MRTISLEELLEAGCHFGHQVTRQNPKARDYVFESRDNIHIIDLGKTKEELEKAAHFVKELAKNGGTMIMLGAKRQAEPVIKDEAKRAADAGAEGLYWVTNRWIGGILTNFQEVSKNFKKLDDIKKRLTNEDEKSGYTKKEISLWEKERNKLESFYGGVASMTRVPDAVYIIDTHTEDLAVRETLATGVKSVGITDTNSDPTLITYPIPANDDAVGSIKLITAYIVDAWIEGWKQGQDKAKAESGKNDGEKKKEQPSEKKEETKVAEDSKVEKVKEIVKGEDDKKKEEKPKAKKSSKKTKDSESSSE